VLDACLSSGALRSLSLPAPGSPPASPPRHQAVAALQAEAAASAAPSGASRASSGFGGPAFWAALREVDDLERDVRELLAEARQVLRRRGALSLVVRAPQARARPFAGLSRAVRAHSLAPRAAGRAGPGVRAAAGGPARRARTARGGRPGGRPGGGRRRPAAARGQAHHHHGGRPGTRAPRRAPPPVPCRPAPLRAAQPGRARGAQVMGLVGSSRKRILLLWQAVEFSRSCDRPNLATLQARRPAPPGPQRARRQPSRA